MLKTDESDLVRQRQALVLDRLFSLIDDLRQPFPKLLTGVDLPT